MFTFSLPKLEASLTPKMGVTLNLAEALRLRKSSDFLMFTASHQSCIENDFLMI